MGKQSRTGTNASGTWNFRGIPAQTMRRAKIAATVEGKTIKALLIELIDQRWEELERRGQLSKT